MESNKENITLRNMKLEIDRKALPQQDSLKNYVSKELDQLF
jgi:hypothetical protein